MRAWVYLQLTKPSLVVPALDKGEPVLSAAGQFSAAAKPTADMRKTKLKRVIVKKKKS